MPSQATVLQAAAVRSRRAQAEPSQLAAGLDRQALIADVVKGLTHTPQRQLASKYLYDALGSALFDAITLLPQYGLTRAEERLLQAHADAVFAPLGGVAHIAELGSGSGRKTRLLLQACARRNAAAYYPIEISAAALAQCESALADIDGIDITGLQCDYLQGLREVAERRGPPAAAGQQDAPLLVLFLGSTIGNFERPAAARFLGEVRDLMRPGDALLLGADLDKPRDQLIDAYDDPLGVTAAFNLNLLVRLNRELGADFDLRRFRHEARFNEDKRAIEMHLRSLTLQRVEIPGAALSITLQAGETLWTEACHKFLPDEVVALGAQAGFARRAQWLDAAWPFALTLLAAV